MKFVLRMCSLRRLIVSQSADNSRAKSLKAGRWHDFRSYPDWQEVTEVTQKRREAEGRK